MTKRERLLLEALREIADPIAAFKRKADAEGSRLSELAYSISRDPDYLQGVARKALRAHGEQAREKKP